MVESRRTASSTGTEQRKVLGQVNPAANLAVALYSCQGSAVVSTIFVCNMSAATTIRIWVQKAGETLAAKQYLYYDLALNASETLAVTSGVTLANGDVLMVRAAAATVAFSAFGVETR